MPETIRDKVMKLVKSYFATDRVEPSWSFSDDLHLGDDEEEFTCFLEWLEEEYGLPSSLGPMTMEDCPTPAALVDIIERRLQEETRDEARRQGLGG